MKVVLAAAGSRGDVVPLGALAARLVGRGHQVTVLTHASLLPVLPDGVESVGVASDPAALMAGPAARAVRSGSPRALNRTRHLFADFLHAFAEPAREILRGADVLVASTFAVAAVDEARRLGVPVVRAHQWPESPGLDGPMPLLPYAWRLAPRVRRQARRGLRSVEGYLAGFDGWWERGRLRIVPHHPVGLATTTAGTLYAFSPLVDPEAVRTASPGTCVTGWWRPASGRPLSVRTQRLLDTPGPWVYVGFGSMHQRAPQHLLQVVEDACRRADVRAVVQLPGAPQDPAGRVVGIGEEPHDALFPRVDAVVHHGGSGTTGAGVLSGVPAVVVPHFADQYHWAHQLHRAGVAARPLPRPLLDARRLAARLGEATAAATRDRATDLGRRVRAEDGTLTAAEHLEQLVLRAGG